MSVWDKVQFQWVLPASLLPNRSPTSRPWPTSQPLPRHTEWPAASRTLHALLFLARSILSPDGRLSSYSLFKTQVKYDLKEAFPGAPRSFLRVFVSWTPHTIAVVMYYNNLSASWNSPGAFMRMKTPPCSSSYPQGYWTAGMGSWWSWTKWLNGPSRQPECLVMSLGYILRRRPWSCCTRQSLFQKLSVSFCVRITPAKWQITSWQRSLGYPQSQNRIC